MDVILKVSPKGQVILPKKIRERLKVTNLISIEVDDHEAKVKRPVLSSERLAGCFKKYTAGKKISIEKAIDRAARIVAYEIAGKNH
jgi:bifunctional DNA-binding transcriptional regulator/antitoxin component of YhaV-PrlF toxin-antitoxin module